jgi:integrase
MMPSHNPNNERIKRQYFTYLKEAHRQNEASVDEAAKALARFEADTGYRDFRNFRLEQAVAFKKRLSEQRSQATGERLSKATLHSTLRNLKRFFVWLAGQPGYKSRITYSDAEYFNLSDKDRRIATARREKRFPTLEQVRHVIQTMPSTSDIELRNRALVAFTLLSGARDSAIASMMLKHVDLVGGYVYQDAREVQTKFSKTFTTWFFPVGEDVLRILVHWVTYLRSEKLWGNADPLFPATAIAVGSTLRFESSGLKREHWSTAAPIRAIFRDAFIAAGLPYFNPHSFRDTLTHLGQSLCTTAEDFKAWSQNLGHERMATTFFSYGAVSSRRQAEIIQQLAKPRERLRPEIRELARAVAVEVTATLREPKPSEGE